MNASNTPGGDVATIDAGEASHFGALAEDWWDPRGRSAMLHRINPVRLRYVRQAIDHHLHHAATERRPLEGQAALDVGCGGGLLTEPLARLGASVTGMAAAAPAHLHVRWELHLGRARGLLAAPSASLDELRQLRQQHVDDDVHQGRTHVELERVRVAE